MLSKMLITPDSHANIFSTVGNFYFVLEFTTVKNVNTVFTKVLRATETFWIVTCEVYCHGDGSPWLAGLEIGDLFHLNVISFIFKCITLNLSKVQNNNKLTMCKDLVWLLVSLIYGFFFLS